MGKKRSSLSTLTFVFVLCLVCAVLLAVVSTALKSKQDQAKANYLIQQLLVSARILNYQGYFEIATEEAKMQFAVFDGEKLIPSEKKMKATTAQIKTVYDKRVKPMLADISGKSFTFEEVGLEYGIYFDKHKKEGFSGLKYKLYYEISANGDDNKNYALTFPISGFGLWDAIHALISVEPDCTTILGFSCYDQKETPGLGGEIAEPWWQNQFYQKKIFLESKDGKINFPVAPLGIDVVKPGKMDTLSKQQKKSSVDGITGASITSNGIMQAIQKSLEPYRNLLIRKRTDYEKLNEKNQSKGRSNRKKK